MFLEAVRSEGLSHISYVVGDSGKAAVIDPRRDCSVYLDIARHYGARIAHIFETHRNEDFVTGSKELSLLTAASVYHGGKTAFLFGNPVFDGDRFDLGNICLAILETPGHTPESISVVLYDQRHPDDPIAVFTGDTLLIGETGRVDMFPGKQRESAGQLYDSIFNKLLPLGDHVVMYPSHSGTGKSATASERAFSSLGFERRNNPEFSRASRDAFIAHKTAEVNWHPPCYPLMLRLNLEGPPLMNGLPQPQPYSTEDFASAMELDMFVLDTRSPEAICGAYIPGTLAISLEHLSRFAGWLVPYDRPLGLVVGKHDHVDAAVRHLIRIGLETIQAYLAEDVYSWEIAGRKYSSIPSVRLADAIQDREKHTIVNVCMRRTVEPVFNAGILNIFVGELPDRLSEIPRNRPVVLYCMNGALSVTAATILRMNGFERLEIALGALETDIPARHAAAPA